MFHLRARMIAILAAAACLLSLPGVATAKDGGQLKAEIASNDATTLVMHWKGTVGGSMAQDIDQAFQARKQQVKRVVFVIDSGGGSINEGERAIEVLRRIRQTHKLETVVNHGKMCGSMCVFIYMQGQKRVAALTSSWLFHEASKSKGDRIVSLDRAIWERLIDQYFVPEGVSREWIAKMKPLTHRIDYWQTGSDLVADRSGIIHEALGNQKGRVVDDGKPPGPPVKRIAARDLPLPAPHALPRAPERTAEPNVPKSSPQPVARPSEPSASPEKACRTTIYGAEIPCEFIASLGR